jgi:cation diffusion facilitator family transporter
MSNKANSKLPVIAAIIGNVTIAIIKFVAAVITGSSAMISEGIHSLVDTGNGTLLLHGMKEANKPADEMHPFGYGKSLYFWTLVVSVSIFGIGGGMSLYEGISHIRHVAPEVVTSDPTAGYIVLAISAIIEGWSFSIAVREFWKAKGSKSPLQFIKETKDPSNYTVVLEDSAALLGLCFALLGIFFSHMLHNPYLDGVASIIIGLLLMGVAFILAFETKGLLLGEGVDAKTMADLRRRVAADPDVAHVGNILSMYIGPHTLLLNMEVGFRTGLSLEKTHEAIHRIEQSIQCDYPECTRIYIETYTFTQGQATECLKKADS